MTHQNQKTIAAIATPFGQGGLGVVRISGPEARSIAQKVFRAAQGKSLLAARGYTAFYGRVYDDRGTFDEAVALVFAAPHSYTGEDVVELSCHGGAYLLSRLLSACYAAGAAPAAAGEFTRRALMAGKLTLTQCEAVADLIASDSAVLARAALSARDGALFREISRIRGSLTDLSAHLSAWHDFPEEDVEELTPRALMATLNPAIRDLEALLSRSRGLSLLKTGVTVAICGKPNVGKSTLMNQLAGYSRSIVTEIPGTTRDVVEETVYFGDLKLILADTAGLRASSDKVEQMGVALTRRRMETAQLLFVMFDVSRPLDEQDKAVIEGCKDAPAIAILNKTDLPQAFDPAVLGENFLAVLPLSAKQGRGMEELKKAVTEIVLEQRFDPAAPLLANERQLDCARRALASLREVKAAVEVGMTLDAAGVDLEDAIAALAELTGERASDSIIDAVFAQFCVGK